MLSRKELAEEALQEAYVRPVGYTCYIITCADFMA